MSFVKWLRKNNTKIMAVVVIVLMIGFIGWEALSYLLQGSGGLKDTVAFYGGKHKITNYDLVTAREELELLQALQADRVLQAQDLRGVLLSELLFSQSRGSPAVMNQVLQMIRRSQLDISEKQLAAIYERTVPPTFYWLLLREEAHSAGIRVPHEEVGQLLGQIIPQLFPGQTYPAVIGSLAGRFGRSEQTILETFGDLLSILQYAQTICSTENITLSQARHMASRQNEMMSLEFVELPASAFADKQNEPPADALQAHFDKYRNNYQGDVTADNPFGFGYKLPARVQLDYMAVKLSDVASIVPPPTHTEAEQFYQVNRRQLFTEQVRSDPNDPNSKMVEKVTPYAEVADTILEDLKQQKINTKAEQILQEARSLADANIEVVAADGNEPDPEQLRQNAGDYAKIAQQLRDKYAIPIHQGQTGWLNPVDVQSDTYLGRLIVPNYGANPAPLSQVLFSVKALGEDAATILFAPSARMHTTIGPATNSMNAMGPDLSGQIMAVVRIAGAEEAGPPQDLQVSFSTKTFELGEPASSNVFDTYSVRKRVVEDVRKLAAWSTTTARAQEFADLAAKEGWEPAVAKFNELYGEQAKSDPNDPNVFKLDTMMGLRRISDAQIQVVAAQTANNPASGMILNNARVEQQFTDKLHALIPAGADAMAKAPYVLPFEPSQSAYVLKDLSIQRLNQAQYDSMKGSLLQQEEYMRTQSLSVVHFNPGNILKRMNFRLNKPAEEPAEGQAEQQSKDAA